ncbi:MAG: VIT1/CCC1 transporter family protein [Candidatus Nanopelagicales bacterium]|nr:VIT1/CCC1 transporter family protein [Candidatus Nanopelagicales bacterium]MCH9679666.1 VIT1/CCC1 transporter family protein [Actinomycetes bacterium]MCH9787529.1 VIT1/CCC1 transporter family protein [Actinomycetes bacterium]MCH9850964.1 VIT1/CCC1 transporter family protein [Actinomycetes bacterium]
MSNDPRRFLRYLDAERNASLLYRALAESTDGDQREALLELADVEDKHAQHWVDKLTAYGVEIPPAPTVLNADDEQLVRRARSLGLVSVLDNLEQNEGADAGMYDDEPEALPTMPSDEREHADVFRALKGGEPERFPHRERSTKGAEPWHRTDKSGSVRAAVFGVSDGLVSNTALVMGFAGASLAGAIENSVVLFAGLAGLLAGAFSMAAGEYVSMASQRDLFKREIDLERQELLEKPEEERLELELIYRAKGLPREQARAVADQIMKNPEIALDTLAREELGLDPNELGSAWKAAVSSFFSFAIGASVVVVPYALFSGMTAFVLAVVLALVSLIVVGGLVGYQSGRGVAFSAGRQVLWGVGAAAVTYLVGSLVGVNVG